MIGVIIAVIILWFGGTEVFQETGLTSDDFMKFILLLFAAMQPIRKLGGVNAQILTGLASSERVFSILDTQITVHDKETTYNLNEFKESICFKNVYFKYELGEKPSLKNINITIE